MENEDSTKTEDANRDLELGYSDEDDVMQGEKPESLSSIDTIFNPEQAVLFSIRKTLLGWEMKDGEWYPTGEAAASTEVINKILNTMRSFVNSTNFLSKKDEEDIHFNMLELNNLVIYTLYDEEDNEIDIEYIVDVVDHTVNMYMGIIQDGQGLEAVKQVYTGNYKHIPDSNKDDNPLFQWNAGESNLLKAGGKR